jgi:hypothetical protein
VDHYRREERIALIHILTWQEAGPCILTRRDPETYSLASLNRNVPLHGGIPKTFTSYLAGYLDESTLSGLIGLFEGNPNVGRTCADHVREYRNLLHPAVCLKEGRQPSKDAGLTAAFLFMIAFSSLAGA